MHPSRRTRPLPAPLVALAAAILAVPAVAGCGADPLPSGGAGGRDEHAVAADPNASAANIVEAGRPVDVAEGNGLTLVTYRVESDDDEGPQQGAWRLYDADDHRLADGTFGIVREQDAIARAHAAGDGFVLVSYTEPRLRHVGRTGGLTDVPVTGQVSPAQPGDLLLEAGDEEGPLVYRPAERAAYLLPRIPFRDSQRFVLDEQGTVWVLREWSRHRIPVAHAQGGVGPWTETEVPSAPNDYPLSLGAEHGRVVVAVGHGADEYPRVVSFAALDTAHAAAGWNAVAPQGVSARNTLDPEVRVLPDGRLLFVAWREGAWLQSGSGFEALDLPDSEGSEPDLTVLPAGDRLFALPTLGRRLLVSADHGSSWDPFDR